MTNSVAKQNLPTQPKTLPFVRGNRGNPMTSGSGHHQCPKCNGPVLTYGTTCGRCLLVTDTTKALKLAGAAIHGETGRNENETSMDLSDFADKAPAVHGMALYAMKHADAAAVMAAEISGKRFSPAGHRGKFWPGAEDTHVNYRPKTVGGLI